MFSLQPSFSRSLAAICASLNHEPYIIRATLIDLNPVELKYYSFIISIDKCTGSFNALSPKICVPKETKNINVKSFNMITNQNEAKRMTKHISCAFKCKCNRTTCILNQKLNNKTCSCECKSYPKCKKGYTWIPSTCIWANSKYLKSIVDTSVIACDEIISVMDTVSSRMTDTIATNVMSTASINYNSKKLKHRSKLKTILPC